MKKLVVSLLLGAGLMAGLILAAHQAQTQEGAPSEVVALPPAPDPFPKGCVSCHINNPERKLDGRLSVGLKKWAQQVPPKLLAKAQAAAPKGMKLSGKHPPIPVTTVPNGCLACHGRNSKIAPPMAQMIHLIHLVGGEENHYIKEFGGKCVNCHKLNNTNGLWTLPNGPELPAKPN